MKILTCNCQHQFQDSVYGRFQRVHNSCKKESVFRCTVCGTSKILFESKKK